MSWLRTGGEVIVPNNMTKEELLREAQFYSISPLVELLSNNGDCEEQNNNCIDGLDCPDEIKKYVSDYFHRHETTINTVLRSLNKEGNTSVSIQIIPGHQDFERSPQLLPENGKL